LDRSESGGNIVEKITGEHFAPITSLDFHPAQKQIKSTDVILINSIIHSVLVFKFNAFFLY
jgi:hypothetical protein